MHADQPRAANPEFFQIRVYSCSFAVKTDRDLTPLNDLQICMAKAK